MNIAFLNDCYLNEEHLERLRRLGSLTVYDDTDSESGCIERLKGVEIAIVDGFKAPLGTRVIESADALRLLVIPSTAFHMVDLDAANRKGMKVANVPGFSTEAVAEHAIALMFAVIKSIPLGDREVRKTPFEISGTESDERFLGFDVKGKTLGVIGLGAIGARVAEIGSALGMKIVAYNRTPRDVPNVEMLGLEALLRTSDVVSVNLALTPETEYIISDKTLALMKPTAILINTAIGKHVNTKALYKALKEKKIFGAGLDALAEWDEGNPLLELGNIVLSPHSAWWTNEACANLAETVTENVESFVGGEPRNLVN